jgi:hypothetical protein
MTTKRSLIRQPRVTRPSVDDLLDIIRENVHRADALATAAGLLLEIEPLSVTSDEDRKRLDRLSYLVDDTREATSAACYALQLHDEAAR